MTWETVSESGEGGRWSGHPSSPSVVLWWAATLGASVFVKVSYLERVVLFCAALLDAEELEAVNGKGVCSTFPATRSMPPCVVSVPVVSAFCLCSPAPLRATRCGAGCSSNNRSSVPWWSCQLASEYLPERMHLISPVISPAPCPLSAGGPGGGLPVIGGSACSQMKPSTTDMQQINTMSFHLLPTPPSPPPLPVCCRWAR